MRAVAFDLGARRVGVAVSDSAGLMAVPHGTVERTGDATADRARLVAVAEELGAERVVVGLPLSMDGSRGPAARDVEAEVDALRAVLGVPVELIDERLTTVTATRSLSGAGVRSRARRPVVDQVAATVILQSWLDGQRRAAPSGPRSETA